MTIQEIQDNWDAKIKRDWGENPVPRCKTCGSRLLRSEVEDIKSGRRSLCSTGGGLGPPDDD